MLSLQLLLVALFSFATLSSAAPSPLNAPLHVPLTRRAVTRRSNNATETLARYSKAADFVRQKYGYISKSEFKKRQSTTGFSITNQVCKALFPEFPVQRFALPQSLMLPCRLL